MSRDAYPNRNMTACRRCLRARFPPFTPHSRSNDAGQPALGQGERKFRVPEAMGRVNASGLAYPTTLGAARAP